MGMRQYRGKRRQQDPSQIAPERGGTPSGGVAWESGGEPSPAPAPAQGGGQQPARPNVAGFPRNARMANFTFITKTVSEQVMPGNPNRTYFAMQNRGSSAVFVSFGQKASEETFRLVAGGFYEPYVPPNTSVNIKGVAAGDQVVIIEGTAGSGS